MTATAYTVGTVAPGEACLTIRPAVPRNVTRPGVLFVHGAGSTATYCIDPYGRQSSLTGAIAQAGYVGMSGDHGGVNTWGNSTAMVRLSAAYAFLQGQPGVTPGKVFLISGSMGGLTSLNWAAANPDKVAGIVSVIPVISPGDIVANHRTLAGTDYAPMVNAAYTGGWSDAAYGATSSPRIMAATTAKLRGIPMQLWYGLTDPLCIPAETEAFAASPGMTVDLHPLPTGHEQASYSAVDHQAVIDFLAAHS